MGGGDWSLTSTVILEVWAAVSHVETVVVTVAGLVLRVHDDGVDVGLLDDTVTILALTAQLGFLTAAHERAGAVLGQSTREDKGKQQIHLLTCWYHFNHLLMKV